MLNPKFLHVHPKFLHVKPQISTCLPHFFTYIFLKKIHLGQSYQWLQRFLFFGQKL